MKKHLTLAISAALAAHLSAQTPAPAPAAGADALYRQGQAAEKAGDVAAAEKAYLAALRANPRHANARYSLGELKINAQSISARGREAKFGAVLVPAFQLDGASLQEALDALRVIVEKQSNEQVTPNFVVQDPKNQLAAAKISMNLKSMPSKAVMQYLMDQSGAKARYDEHAIVISPK